MIQGLLVLVLARLNINRNWLYYIGFALIFIAYIIMNMVNKMNTDQIVFYTKVFFMLLSVSVFFIASSSNTNNFITNTIIDLSIANIIDEFTGKGCEVVWYEIPLAAIIVLLNYLIIKYKWKV